MPQYFEQCVNIPHKLLRCSLGDLSVLVNTPTTECSETPIGRLRHLKDYKHRCS